MTDVLKVDRSVVRIIKGDITDLEIESFVFYAQHNLELGSGFGGAIAVRGGPSVQEELKTFGHLQTTEAVVTGAGDMKAKYIIHAVGPRFQEENLESKLCETILNSLRKAEEKGIKVIAFPPMGTGFYGVPLDLSARVTLGTLKEYLSGKTNLEDVVICLLDNREYKPFEKQLAAMAGA